MELKIDRYTKVILTLIAVGLFANLFRNSLPAVHTPLNPEPVLANVAMGSTMANGQRLITVSPDGKTVYMWFREEDKQWFDRDKLRFVGQETAEER